MRSLHFKVKDDPRLTSMHDLILKAFSSAGLVLPQVCLPARHCPKVAWRLARRLSVGQLMERSGVPPS